MRKVYDDKHYEEVSARINKIIERIPAHEVSMYEHGMNRVKVSLVRQYIWERMGIDFGKNEHAHGIGNNNALEIIVTEDNEQQVCGLLHLTNDMFGGVYAWVSDIDGNRETPTRHIR